MREDTAGAEHDYGDDGEFLIREGLDLIAGYRAIRSKIARQAILTMVATIAEAERKAEQAANAGSF